MTVLQYGADTEGPLQVLLIFCDNMLGRTSQEKEEREKEKAEKQEKEQEARAKKEEEEKKAKKTQQEAEKKKLEVSGRNVVQKNRVVRRLQSRATMFQRNFHHCHSPRLDINVCSAFSKNALHSLHPKVVDVETRHEKVFLWNSGATGKLARWRRKS